MKLLVLTTKLWFKTTFHSLCMLYYAVFYAFALKYMNSITEEMSKKQAVSNMQRFSLLYYTQWSIIASTVYFVMAFIYDILENRTVPDVFESKPMKTFYKVKNIIYGSTVITNVPNVVVYFWSHYWSNKEDVYPEDLEFIPHWFNHFLHTYPILLVLGETLVDAKREPTNMKIELIINTVVTLSSVASYLGIYFIYGIFLYGTHYRSWWITTIDLTCCVACTYVYYFAIYGLNRLIHGKEILLEFTKNGHTVNGKTVNK